MKTTHQLTTALLLLLSTGCKTGEDEAPAPLIHFDSAAVSIITASDTIQVKAEVADSDDERGYGLMDRAKLDENGGMLFVYDAEQDSGSGFWMFRTKVPLDIAFADSAGVIRVILQMDPCERIQPELCRGYSPGAAYNTALEVNRGFFARHGIAPGARIVWTR